jgi:phycocyanobilin lyase alpha subunit
MYQLTGEDAYGSRLVEALQGKDVVLRRVALSDLGAIGYLPAAEAIATAPAENSFKLMALKGLLEKQLDTAANTTLSDDAIRVIDLMDSLL